MPRNLDRRVEVAFEISDDKLCEKIKKILNLTLKDSVKARIQQPDKIRYKRIDKRGKEPVQSQDAFYRAAKKYAADFKKDKTKDVVIPIYNDK